MKAVDVGLGGFHGPKLGLQEGQVHFEDGIAGSLRRGLLEQVILEPHPRRRKRAAVKHGLDKIGMGR